MTSRYTNAEWTDIFADVEKNLVIAKDSCPLPEVEESGAELSKFIDHTLLKLDATQSQIDEICNEARRENFKAVCVREKFVARAVSNLKGTDIGVACVVGFHEGTYDTAEKAKEATAAVQSGAAELDIVLNYPSLKAGSFEKVYNELATIRALATQPVVLKLILETSQLSSTEIIAASVLAASASFDFIKTSTGFNGRGASLDDVYLMRSVAIEMAKRKVGKTGSDGKITQMSVKASGGVRNLKDTLKMIEAGANRIGTSSGVWIMQETREAAKGEDSRPAVSRLYTDETY